MGVEPAARYPSLPYVAPFAIFMAFLALSRGGGSEWLYPVRVIAVSAALIFFSRRVIDFRTSHVLGSVLLGVAVFVIWIAPDALWPSYRSHWLFRNFVTGEASSSVPTTVQTNLVFIIFRTIGCTLLVPVMEELFWRGWLTRWIIDGEDFRRVPLGTYTPLSFWAGSLLFASEHGPFWEVGLIAGMLYNWWMIRTRSLADCILAHAVTNGCLSAYVLITWRWQYWL